MKKITLILILLTVSFGYSQQQIYNFGFEPGDADGVIANWATFESTTPAPQIITNPDPDGVNTSTTTQVMQLNVLQAGDCFAGVGSLSPTLGTWELDTGVASNLTLSMDVNKNIIGPIGIKMATTTNGTTFDIPNSQSNTVVDQWETLTWDLTGLISGDNTNISQMIVYMDFVCGGSRPSDVQMYIDNITFGANKLTDPALPTCMDGIQNGNETGVDCGGPDCPACIMDPTVSAPESSSTGTDLYVYSDIGAGVSNFNFNAFAGGGVIVTEEDIESNGNSTGKLVNLGFYGAQWDAVDLVAGSYNFVHIDYYATTSSAFNFFLIDQTAGIPGGAIEEPRFAFSTTGGDETFVQGQWNSTFIPLQHFLDYNSGTFTFDLNDIIQWKFDGNGTIFFDNIYFSTTNVLGTEDFELSEFKVFPNPAQNAWNIRSNNQNINSVEVFDILGKSVMSLTPNSSDVNIEATALKSGLYFARISSEAGSKNIKLIKQ